MAEEKKNTVVLISTFHRKDVKTKMKNYLYKVNLSHGSFDKSKIWHQKNPPTKQKQTHRQENRLWVSRRRGGSLGLAHANYYT